MTTKPVATTAQMVEQLRINWNGGDDYGQHRDWSDRSSVGYTFLSDSGDGLFWSERNDYVPMSDTQKNFARLAFELWDDVVPLNIGETTASRADITFAHSVALDDREAGHTHTDEEWSGTHLTGAQIEMNARWTGLDQDSDLSIGSEGFKSYLHEIGHSLGLTHPGLYNADDDHAPTYADDARFAQDTRQYTVMSYFDAGADGSGANHWFRQDGAWHMAFASTPLLYDIAAVQAIYGVDTETRTDNTVYGFNSNAGKVIHGVALNPYSFDENPHPVFCIWDAGGTDTIDASGFHTAQHITLEQGAFSSMGDAGMTQNVSIAFGAVIENAIGGSGDDEIRGNAADNRLDGGGGNDTLYAGVGVDTLVGGSGRDILWGSGDDRLEGGADDDIYYITGRDTVIELAGQGRDTVYTDLAGHTMTPNVEDLVFTNPEFYPTNPHTAFGNGVANNITGTDGVDTFYGAAGNDHLYGRGGSDTLHGGLGDDWLYGGEGNDTLNGNENADHLYGGTNADTLNGGAGNDFLYGEDGNDILRGDAGIDQITGGGGKDTLTGGADADTFVFNSVGDSSVWTLLLSTVDNVDTITDFVHGVDKIDLRGIDANAATTLNDAFTFLSSIDGYTGGWTGKVWFDQQAEYLSDPFGGTSLVPVFAKTTIYASTNADAMAEFQVTLNGLVPLTASDFWL